MNDWEYEINIKQYLTEDTTWETLENAAHGIAKEFRKLPEDLFSFDDLDNIEPGLSKKFITNVKNDMKNPPDYNPEFILILSFDFSETSEGKEYWKNVGNKLIENLENSNDKN